MNPSLLLKTVILTGASRRLFFAFARANASACIVEEPLFDFNNYRPRGIQRALVDHHALTTVSPIRHAK
jgi:hypothetical protein